MEMSIDEALNLLNNSKPKSNNAFSIQMNEAINVIGVTMRKYQRIQAIINNAKDSDDAVKYNWLYEQIGEVIEHE